MQRTPGRRLASASFVLAGTAAVVAFGAATAWAAASVSGTPATNLKDGSTITITGTGFGSGTPLFVVQCSGTEAESCDTARLSSTVSDADGNVSTTFTVHTGAIGDGTCDAGSTGCIVAVTDLAKQYVGAFPVSFAAAASSPSPSPSQSAPGTTSPSTSGAGGSTTTGGSGSAAASGGGSGSGTPTTVAAGSGGAAGRQGPHVALALGLAAAGALATAGTVLLHRRRRPDEA